MQFITEQQIDEAAEQLEQSEALFEACISDLETRQPVILAYIFSEDLQLLTQEEREYLLYLLVVIWQVFRNQELEIPAVDETRLADAEEMNWSKLQDVQARHFHERLDVFFENYPQEDLLAFLEDALSEVEEGEILTREGREPLFISLKSILDCFIE